ncbi:MAG: hypothetical protein LBD55_09900, partial [Treponema sp.]|nr:hypothetical protein [Treponema sp.]
RRIFQGTDDYYRPFPALCTQIPVDLRAFYTLQKLNAFALKFISFRLLFILYCGIIIETLN